MYIKNSYTTKQHYRRLISNTQMHCKRNLHNNEQLNLLNTLSPGVQIYIYIYNNIHIYSAP